MAITKVELGYTICGNNNQPAGDRCVAALVKGVVVDKISTIDVPANWYAIVTQEGDRINTANGKFIAECTDKRLAELLDLDRGDLRDHKTYSFYFFRKHQFSFEFGDGMDVYDDERKMSYHIGFAGDCAVHVEDGFDLLTQLGSQCVKQKDIEGDNREIIKKLRETSKSVLATLRESGAITLRKLLDGEVDITGVVSMEIKNKLNRYDTMLSQRGLAVDNITMRHIKLTIPDDIDRYRTR